MAVFVRVPVQKRNVFSRDFDVARSHLGQAASQQTTHAKAAGGLGFVGAIARLGGADGFARIDALGQILFHVLDRFQRKIKRFRCRRAEQPIGIVHRSEQRLLLIITAVLADRTGGQKLFVKLLAALKS